MWNAVYLEGIANIQKLNLAVAVEKLCIAIENHREISNIKTSHSTNKKLIKAQKLLEEKKSYEDVVYELIKTKGLSKRAFKRTLTYSKKSNIDIFYVNYKFLDYIIFNIIRYILVIDKRILGDLLNISMQIYAGEDSIMFRTIPVRKVLIQNIGIAYNNGEECYLKNKYFQKKLLLLNKRLDEINLAWGDVI